MSVIITEEKDQITFHIPAWTMTTKDMEIRNMYDMIEKVGEEIKRQMSDQFSCWLNSPVQTTPRFTKTF